MPCPPLPQRPSFCRCAIWLIFLPLHEAEILWFLPAPRVSFSMSIFTQIAVFMVVRSAFNVKLSALSFQSILIDWLIDWVQAGSWYVMWYVIVCSFLRVGTRMVSFHPCVFFFFFSSCLVCTVTGLALSARLCVVFWFMILSGMVVGPQFNGMSGLGLYVHLPTAVCVTSCRLERGKDGSFLPCLERERMREKAPYILYVLVWLLFSSPPYLLTAIYLPTVKWNAVVFDVHYCFFFLLLCAFSFSTRQSAVWLWYMYIHNPFCLSRAPAPALPILSYPIPDSV